MKNFEKDIIDLLKETGTAHHQAFIAVDGHDLEWPIWYADFGYDRMTRFLGNSFTKSEYIYSLVHLSKMHPIEAPDTPWFEFYADYLTNNY